MGEPLSLSHISDLEVKRAFSNSEFSLAYQPMIELLCSYGAARAVHLLAYHGDVQTAAAVFAGVALAHFVVTVAGQVLAPLSLVHRFVPALGGDYPEIALTSAGFGVAAVGVVSLWWRLRRAARREG